MILIIDNYDSFTYNLVQAVASQGYEVKVVLHDKIDINQIIKLDPDKIILSPGPGKPNDAGICLDTIDAFYKTVPILGVCLGHQCIGQYFGSRIIPAQKLLRGKTSPIYHYNRGLFQNCTDPMIGARYHSLVIDRIPEHFEQTAWDSEKDIMGIQHRDLPVFGIQFHPESFLTPEGDALLERFLNAQH